MTKGKILSLDFGDRRVGVAISDLDKEVAFPRDVLTIKKMSDLLNEIRSLCHAESVVKIVLGLPIEMDGTWGERAKKTEAFRKKLEAAIPGIEIEYFDERLTSVEAGKILQEQGYKTHEHKGKIDAIAAQKILEHYLASRRS